VSSELDPEKNAHLLRHLSALPGQAFLTTTDRRLLEPAAGAGAAFYRVTDGAFEPGT
jgi:DNA replication and repair protein RecF